MLPQKEWELAQLLGCIDQADSAEIGRIVGHAMDRYRELFPEYDIAVLSLPKAPGEARRQTVERVLEFLEQNPQI